MTKQVKINKGDTFSIGLETGYAGGIVTERGETPALLIAVPLVRFMSIPTPQNILEAMEQSLVYETVVGRLGFKSGNWSLIGHLDSIPPPFDEHPGFFNAPDTLVWKFDKSLLRCDEIVPLEEYHGRITRIGVSGHRYVEEVLEDMVDSGEFKEHIRNQLPPAWQSPKAYPKPQ